MIKKKLPGLIGLLLLVISMALSSCGPSAPEFPPAELTDEMCFGYSIGVPDYYSNNGFSYDEEKRCRVSEIDDQAVLRIYRMLYEPGYDDFDGDLITAFGEMAGLDASALTAEETEIGGSPGMKLSGTDADGNELRSVIFNNEVYGSVIAVTVQEYANDVEKEHAYIDDFELIPDTIRPIGPEEHLAALGYTMDIPDYYEKFIPVDRGMQIVYACYSNPDANLDMTINEGAGGDSMDKSVSGLEESLRFDEETGIDINVSDEVTKGPARIRQYTYSYSGMSAGGAGALIYDSDKDIMIEINLMESGYGDEDFAGDFRKMIDGMSVAE